MDVIAAGRSESVADLAPGIDFHLQGGTALGIAASYRSIGILLIPTGDLGDHVPITAVSVLSPFDGFQVFTFDQDRIAVPSPGHPPAPSRGGTSSKPTRCSAAG